MQTMQLANRFVDKYGREFGVCKQLLIQVESQTRSRMPNFLTVGEIPANHGWQIFGSRANGVMGPLDSEW